MLHGKTRAECRSVDPTVSSIIPASTIFVLPNRSVYGVEAAFSRLLTADACSVGSAPPACSGSLAGMRSVSAFDNLVLWFVFATGLPGRGRLGTHTPMTAGAVRVNLATGEVVTYTPPSALELAGIILVIFGGAMLLPLGLAAHPKFSRSRAVRTPPSSHMSSQLLGHRFFTACGACFVLSGAAILAACADARLGTYLSAVRSSLVLLTQFTRSFGAALSACCVVLLVTTSTLRCWAPWLARTPLPVVAVQQRTVDESSTQGLESSLDYFSPPRRHTSTAAPEAGSVTFSASPMVRTHVSVISLDSGSAISVAPKQGAPPSIPAPPPRCAALALLGTHTLALALTLLAAPALLLLYLFTLQVGPAVVGSGSAVYLLLVVVVLVSPRALACAGPRTTSY